MTVYTNIPHQQRTIRLTLQGEAWQPLEVKPRSADFGRLAPEAVQGPSLVRKLTIVNNMEDDAEIANIRSTNPMFHAETTVIEPGKKFELAIRALSTLHEGDNRGKIEMSTGIKEMPSLWVPVAAYVMSDVDVNPNALTLAARRPLFLRRHLTIQNNTKKPLKISDLKATNPALTVVLHERESGTIFQIMVDLPAEYEIPPGGDRITFRTNSPSAPEVTIPIVAKEYSRGIGPRKTGTSSGAQPPSGGKR